MNIRKHLTVAWRKFYRWAAHRLYDEFAWAYDAVAWTVSLGHWDGWRKDALAHVCPTRVQSPRVLEIGFGTGELLIEMARRGWHVRGLDLSPAMHRITARKMRKRGVWAPRAQGYTQALPFADGSFDTVIATFPAEYIVAPETLHDVARVLTPEGRFIIAGLVGQIEHPLLRLLLKPIYGDVGDGALRYFAQAAEAAGFETRIETKPSKWVRMPVMILEKGQGAGEKRQGARDRRQRE